MDRKVRVSHSYRESNKCVDVQANMRCDSGGSLIIYELNLPYVRHLLSDDIISVSTPKMINL